MSLGKEPHKKRDRTIWETIEIKALQNFVSIFFEWDQVKIKVNANNKVFNKSIWRKIKKLKSKPRTNSKDIKSWKISQDLWKSA